MNFLFVGRIVPNKKIEDHIRLAEHYKRYVDTDYRFIFVGKTDGVPRYYNMVRALVAEFQMPPDRFIFTGAVPDEDLATLLPDGAASTSRCPSTKASACRCSRRWRPTCRCWPTPRPRCRTRSAALACSSAPKDLEYAAELLGELAFNDDLRARVIAGQRRRLEDFGDDADPASAICASARCRDRCIETCGSLSSFSVTAPRFSAARSTTAGSSPSGWPPGTTSRCSRRARATTSRGRTNTRKAPTAFAA